jgi:hypothetical protein
MLRPESDRIVPFQARHRHRATVCSNEYTVLLMPLSNSYKHADSIFEAIFHASGFRFIISTRPASLFSEVPLSVVVAQNFAG